MQTNIPTGPDFISAEELVKLIQLDKPDDAKVDIQFMVNNIPYLRVNQLFNVRLLKTTPEGKVERDGTLYARIMNDYDKAIVLKALQDVYNSRTGILVNPAELGINKVTTAIDEEKGKTTAQPQINKESSIVVGEKLGNSLNEVNEQKVLRGV